MTPDGQTIVSGAADPDNTIKVWRTGLALPAARLACTALFEEPSGNRALDGYETGMLVLRVRNNGRGPGLGLLPSVTGGGRGIAVTPPSPVRVVQPGEEANLRVSLAADGTLRDGTVQFRVVVQEARGFNTDTVTVEIPTRAERTPALRIARVGLDDDASGQSDGNGDHVFQPNETVELTLFIQNTGEGAAEGVTGMLSTSAPYVYIQSPADGRFTVGNIPPGEYREVRVVISVPNAYTGPALLPVKVSLADRRDRFRWPNLPLGVSLGERIPTAQTVRVEALPLPAPTAPALPAMDSSAPPVTITVVVPAGCSFWYNGVRYTASRAFEEVPGATVPIDCDYRQTDANGVRWRFAGWSDGQPRVRTFTVPASNVTLTASFVRAE